MLGVTQAYVLPEILAGKADGLPQTSKLSFMKLFWQTMEIIQRVGAQARTSNSLRSLYWPTITGLKEHLITTLSTEYFVPHSLRIFRYD